MIDKSTIVNTAPQSRQVDPGGCKPRRARGRVLEQDLGRGFVRAAGEHELDRAMEVGLGMRDLLGERQRVASLDEHVQPPRLDLLAF